MVLVRPSARATTSNQPFYFARFTKRKKQQHKNNYSGCFPLCQRFRKFRSDFKWKNPFRFLLIGKLGITSGGGLLISVGIFRPKFAVPFLTNRFFALIREFARGIKSGKSHFCWLARLNRKMSSHFPWVFVLDRVVRKPVNANPGLKVNRSNDFSSIKILSTAYALCGLRLLMLKTEWQKI